MDTPRLTVTIRGLGASGDGVASLPDGRAVFIPRTAVGDTVSVVLEQNRPRWARARVVDVLEPSVDRRSAPCTHYDRCGGCQLQHLSYDAQLAAKSTRITDALARIGGLSAEVEHVLPSPQELAYRSRARFQLVRGREGKVFAGFHRLSRPGTIVEIGDDCLVVDPAIRAAWASLRGAWGEEAHLLPRGPALELLLRSFAGGVGLTVIGGTRWREAEALLEGASGIRSIWWVPERTAEVKHVAGDVSIPDTWNGEHLEMGGSGFLQANREGATALWDLLTREVGPPAGRHFVDAYCGVGVYGRLLARHGATVSGIELDAHAATTARNGAPDGLTVRVGRVEDLLGRLLPADCVIANPPRQGMHAKAVQALCSTPPAQLIYVSCDPATLARDLAKMADTFEITRLQAIDLFPQTAHVETVVTAVRRTSGNPS